MMGPKEKKERALGEHLHLKGQRCAGPKCALVRRPFRPGVHGHKRQRKNLSDFGRQIREKQKFKISYGVDERNLKSLFARAGKGSAKSSVSDIVLQLLERRLDNVVFRLGIAPSRPAARQLLVHGHILVNGVRVVSPGFQVKPKDAITIRPESMGNTAIKSIREGLKGYEIPEWLELNKETLEASVVKVPTNIEIPFEVNLLVESFSK